MLNDLLKGDEFFLEKMPERLLLESFPRGFLDLRGSIVSLQCMNLQQAFSYQDNPQFIIISTSMKGQQTYIASIRSALEIALCLRDFPSTLVQKDNKPYVELTGYNPKIEPLIMKPIYLARNKKQQFLIEPSINSCRISFTLKRSDEIDSLIAGKFAAMVASRAQAFELMRRKPLKDYDITLLVTHEVLQKYNSSFIIELIISLVGSLEKDLLQIKLNTNTQCRIAATHFMEQLANGQDEQFW